MRQTKENAEKTKFDLMDSAEQLFLKYGVSHTSLQSIAQHAGLTRGAIYWHFKNKNDLLHQMFDQVRLPPQLMAQRLESAPLENQLRALRDLYVDSICSLAKDERKRRVMTILLHHCELTGELQQAGKMHQAYTEKLIDLCEAYLTRTANQLHPGVSPRSAALTLHALLFGLFTEWTRDNNWFDPELEGAALIDPIFRGLAKDWDNI